MFYKTINKLRNFNGIRLNLSAISFGAYKYFLATSLNIKIQLNKITSEDDFNKK